LEHRIARYKIAYDSPLQFYRYTVNGEVVRLNMLYATKKDGSDIVSGVNVRADNIDGSLDLKHTALSDAARVTIINALIPDRSSVHAANLPEAVQQDAEPPSRGADSAFFQSNKAARAVAERWHWDIPHQQWNAAPCSESPTGTVQVFRSQNSSGVQMAGIYSEYLYECMKRSLAG
jgi:hypothetical protein